MTHSLGIALSNKIAAIAPAIATVFGDEQQPKNPVSAIMINGMLDKAVPYKGGPPGGRFPRAWDGTPAKSALDQAEFWSDANACEKKPLEFDQTHFIRRKYRCPAGLGVELYLIKDNGHAWPGGERGGPRGDLPSRSLIATDIIWDFFKAHPKSLWK